MNAQAIIALGANLPSEVGAPAQTLRSALNRLAGRVNVRAVSRFYATPAFPPSDQPPFVNAAALIETALSPHALLDLCLDTEAAFGRERRVSWGPRTLDLDLIDYGGLVLREERLTLPHPSASSRDFVLVPIRDIAPAWRHPGTGEEIGQLLEKLGVRGLALALEMD
ncbi:MAG: 2-amino-4-hydroxy-6-hydroxymethyldihydropteridine diphosphokinase [Alphaproteobacteria bacterium]|nr:2-amino-4-hydroxy-6-hydroxymethyldihydropteridine diphosphokinase [Alphaproteobacteria bacterium]